MTSTQTYRQTPRLGFIGRAQAVFADFSTAKSTAAALVAKRPPNPNDVGRFGINAKSFDRVRFE